MNLKILLFLFAFIPTLSLVPTPSSAREGLDYRHPRPAGYSEPEAPMKEKSLDFRSLSKKASRFYDMTATFPRDSAPEFEVEKVELNGEPVDEFIVENAGIFNGNHRVHGVEDFAVSLEGDWRLAKNYEVQVTGRDAEGEAVRIAPVRTRLDQMWVMAYEDDGAVIFGKRLNQGLAAVDVEMVARTGRGAAGRRCSHGG